MPRGIPKKKMTTDQKIRAAEEKVAKLEVELDAAKEELAGLLERKKEEELEVLRNILAKKGIEVNEVIAMLDKKE